MNQDRAFTNAKFESGKEDLVVHPVKYYGQVKENQNQWEDEALAAQRASVTTRRAVSVKPDW